MRLDAHAPNEVIWVASSLRDLREFPAFVRQSMGFAIFQAQRGGKHVQAKPLRGFKGGVLEVVEDFDGNTFRAMYAVRFTEAIYVLHAFQKKSKRGTETPKHEMDVVRERLRIAERLHRERMSHEGGKQDGLHS
jgi:phage-related protein